MTDLVINKVPIDDPSITVDENGINITQVEFIHTAEASVVKTPDGYYFYHDPSTWAHLVGPYTTEEEAIKEFVAQLVYDPDVTGDSFDMDYMGGFW